MRTGIFDLETSGFYADNAIVLCAVIQEYGKTQTTIIRADQERTWSKHRSDDSLVVKKIMEELNKYDILVAHNGQRFDKGFMNAKCIQYDMPVSLRLKKFVDPVKLARFHLKLGRNSLAAIIDWLEIPVHKTPLELRLWLKASLEGDRKCMDTIVKHCVHDVKSLAIVYNRMRPLIDRIDNRGSAS